MKPDPGLASWLQLSLTPGLGAATLRDLLRRFGLPEAVLARKRAELAAHLVPATLDALDSARASTSSIRRARPSSPPRLPRRERSSPSSPSARRRSRITFHAATA